MGDTRPSENQDDYPKFSTLVGMFGTRETSDTRLRVTVTVRDAIDSLDIAYANGNDRHEVECGNAAALTMATLYLAQQQRTANKIAWLALTGEGSKDEIRSELDS